MNKICESNIIVSHHYKSRLKLNFSYIVLDDGTCETQIVSGFT